MSDLVDESLYGGRSLQLLTVTPVQMNTTMSLSPREYVPGKSSFREIALTIVTNLSSMRPFELGAQGLLVTLHFQARRDKHKRKVEYESFNSKKIALDGHLSPSLQ